MGTQQITPDLLRQILADVRKEYAYPPDVHFAKREVPPPPSAYIGPDDNLQVVIYTTSSTTGLNLSLRWLDAAGGMHYETETLDGVNTSTLTTKIFNLSEGWLLGISVSNLGGGLADQVCFVAVGLQQGVTASRAPHTILAQGYVSNLFTVDWPPVYVRGPAPGGSGLAKAYTDQLVDLPPLSPTVYDDEFDGASFNLSGQWSYDNHSDGSGSVSVGQANSLVTLTTTSQSGYQMRGILETLPSPPWTFTCKLSGGYVGNQNFKHFWLVLRESGTDKRSGIHVVGAASGSTVAQVDHWTSSTSGPSTQGSGSIFSNMLSLYLRIGLAAGTLTYQISPDGWTWPPMFSEAQTTPFTTTPNQVGIAQVNAANDSVSCLVSCDWFRRTT